MATRTKTVEFATTVDPTNLAVSTNRDQNISIYLPESGKTFRSVTLQLICRDNISTAATMTSPTLGISYNGSTWDSVASTNPPANSGESQVFLFQRDVTSYFTTNWSGSSANWVLRFSAAGTATANHWFKLIITYDYDDTSATQVKTIRIPLESTAQYPATTTSWSTLGGATAIPGIGNGGSYIPEASYTLRNASLELWGSEGASSASTTDATLSMRIGGGGGSQNIWLSEQGLTGNACHFRTAYNITSVVNTSAQSLELQTSVASRFGRVGGMIVVTYEFTLAGTTTVFNSLMLGAIDTIGQVPGTTSADADSWSRTFLIEEPTNITMKESAVCLWVQTNAPGGVALNVAVGDQASYTSYTLAGTSSFELGQHSLVHRIDSGGTNGSAFETLARGRNYYELRIYAGTANLFWNLSGFMILNYTSGVSALGPGAHAHTTHQLIAPNNAATSQGRVVNTVAAATLAETSYYVMGLVSEVVVHGSSVAASAVALQAERASGEGPGEGWEPLYSGMATQDVEKNTNVTLYGAPRSAFKRWPADPDTERLDLEVTRSWRLDASPSVYASWSMWTTYHAMTWTVAGAVSGYVDADGAGLSVRIFREYNNELIGVVTTSAGGDYTFTWYDNVDDVFAVCMENATHTGASWKGVASS